MKPFQDQIEPYLLNELAEDDRAAFEASMQTDVDLAQSVREHQEMMQRLEALRLRNKVKKAMPRNTSANQRSGLTTGLLAVVAVGILFLAFLYWFSQRKVVAPPIEPLPPAKPTIVPQDTAKPQEMATTPRVETPQDNFDKPIKVGAKKYQQLAWAYFQKPETAQLREMDETAVDNSVAQQAAAAFEAKDYSKTVALLSSNKLVISDESARFLRGCAFFQLSQFGAAAKDFEALLGSFRFKYDAKWNLALCLLAQGELDKAKIMLSRMVSNPDFPFHAKAVDLYARL